MKQLSSLSEDIKNKESLLNALQARLQNMNNKLRQREAEVERRERHFAAKEANWIKLEDERKNCLTDLTHQLLALERQVAERKENLSKLHIEWNERIAELDAERQAIKRERHEVKSVVDRDLVALKQKEESILNIVKRIEEDNTRLEFEESSIIKRIKQFDKGRETFIKQQELLKGRESAVLKREVSIKSIEKKLNTQLKKVARVKELKMNVQKLEKQYDKIQSVVQKAAARLIGKIVEPKVLRKRATSLNKWERELGDRQSRLTTEERLFEEAKPELMEDVLRQEVLSEIERHKPVEHATEIHNLVDEVRRLIEHGETNNAVRKLVMIEVAIEKVTSTDEKRLLGYEIRDLRTSLKLAML